MGSVWALGFASDPNTHGLGSGGCKLGTDHLAACCMDLGNGLDALFVEFTCSSPCRFVFSTLLIP